MRWEDAFHFASDRVHFLSFPNVLWSVDFELAHASDVPADAQVNFLSFPIFDEHDSPEASESSKGPRVWTREKPCQHATRRGQDEEERIALYEGIIKGDLLSKQCTNLVEVHTIEEGLAREILQEFAVGERVLRRIRGSDTLPVSVARRNPCTTLLFRPSDKVVCGSKCLSWRVRFDYGLTVTQWLGVNNAM